jgi:hypothetical protein
MKNIITIITLFITFLNFSQNVTFTSFPLENQLYPRNILTNSANINTSGNVLESTNYTTVTLKIYRDNTLLTTTVNNLNYNAGNASFSFQTSITAELHNYRFDFFADAILLQTANNIVAGDVYLFQGQSNMRGADSGTTNAKTDFIRSYGKTPLDPQEDVWFINDYVGGIPNYFAINFVTEKNIPIAVINGARGGYNIGLLQRNDTNPLDETTNYGLMLKRFQLAGFSPGDIKAMVFYQGEANHSDSIDSYKNLFYELKSDWEEDYAPPSYYMFQVHKGCGVTTETHQYEAQRQIAIEVANLQLISTNGVSQKSDICHFNYVDGYAIFGERLYNLIDFDIYNSGFNSGIYSPTISNVRFTNNEKTEIKFELQPSSDTFTLENGVESDFFISDNSTISITSASLIGNEVTINLSEGIIKNEPKISYLGTNPDATPIIKNQNDIGLINFKDIEINEPIISELVDGNWTYYYYESDALSPFLGIEKQPAVAGANSNPLEFDINSVNNLNNLSSKNFKEATFNFSIWWNIETSSSSNGWVNIRLFYNTTAETNLNSEALNYKNTQNSAHMSSVLFIQSNEVIDPLNQLDYNGYNIPIFKSGSSSSSGTYNGNNYTQLNEVELNQINGITSLVKVTNLVNFLAPGTLKYNSTDNKFQGWNGTQWVDFN